MSEEQWCYIHTCNEVPYEISDRGRLRNAKTKNLLNPYFHRKSGYHLYRFGHKTRSKLGEAFSTSIHRMVALAFVTNPDIVNNLCVDHIDGNKLNNHRDNLEWVTHSENSLRYHAKKRNNV